jgi:hypothetical protein
MKYPPFSPISADGTLAGNGRQFSNHDIDSAEYSPIYISFSIETNFSDIGNSATSASSIEAEGSEESCQKQSPSQSGGHRRSTYFFGSVNSASTNCDSSHSLHSSPSNDCSSEEYNEKNADRYRAVCNNYNHSLSPENQCMPCSPDNTIVAKNTRRKYDISYDLSEDSDAVANMKTNNVNITPQSIQMTNYGSSKLVNTTCDEATSEDDTMKPFHHFRNFFWQKSASSDKHTQLVMQTNTPNTCVNDGSNNERPFTSPTKTKKESLLISGCIFEPCSRTIDSLDQQSSTTSGDKSWDRKMLCPYRNNKAKTLRQRVEDTNQQDENETEQGIEISVRNLEESSPEHKQTDQTALVLFLQNMTQKKKKKMSPRETLNSFYR